MFNVFLNSFSFEIPFFDYIVYICIIIEKNLIVLIVILKIKHILSNFINNWQSCFQKKTK